MAAKRRARGAGSWRKRRKSSKTWKGAQRTQSKKGSPATECHEKIPTRQLQNTRRWSASRLGFMVQGLGFGVEGLGFRGVERYASPPVHWAQRGSVIAEGEQGCTSSFTSNLLESDQLLTTQGGTLPTRSRAPPWPPRALAFLQAPCEREREFFIDNLLVRVLFVIEMILVDRPRAMGVFELPLVGNWVAPCHDPRSRHSSSSSVLLSSLELSDTQVLCALEHELASSLSAPWSLGKARALGR